MYNICNIKCFAQRKPERNIVLLDNKWASKTSFQDVLHALLTPELNNCVHDLTQLRTWAGAKSSILTDKKNECVLGDQSCRRTILSAFTGRGCFFGNGKQ